MTRLCRPRVRTGSSCSRADFESELDSSSLSPDRARHLPLPPVHLRSGTGRGFCSSGQEAFEYNVSSENPLNTSSRPFDPTRIDHEGFLAELRALRDEIDASLGPDDLRHLRRIERWGRTATALGLATCWIAPNPVSAALLSLGRSTRWLLMHHVGHRGYDKVPGVPAKYTSRVFAQEKRRFLDWADWMRPDAWIYEHNILHHFHTGEERDPDLIERNTEFLRSSGWPMPLRYGLMSLLALTWRASYYAPNTLREFRDRHRDASTPRAEADDRADRKALWTECYLPYATLHFAILPSLFFPIAGPWGAFSAFVNSLGAEALTNLHTFLVVGPNHTGDDLYRFDDRPRGKGEFWIRQVIGSVNYATGGDLTDYAHLWLNYQIEHHLWPDVPMSQYQRVQPKVRALCEKYGIPYVQESVWKRARKMLDIAVGRASMKRPEARNESLSTRHDDGMLADAT